MKILKIAGGVFIVLILIGALSSSGKPQKVGEVIPTSTPNNNNQIEAKPTTQTYKIGDKVSLDGSVVTVYSVSPYKSKNQFMVPKANNKNVVVDVAVKNEGKESLSYNVYDFKLQDNQEYSYTQAITDKEPNFGSGTIQPGQSTRGFIAYEIPETNTAAKLIYSPSFWSHSQIIIELN